MPVRTGVRSAWQEKFGDDFPALSRFLRVTGDSARTFSCGGTRDGCSRRVVTRPNGDIVAVCGAETGECESLKLVRTDLAIYEFDVLMFGSHVAAALGFVGPTETLLGITSAVRLGAHVPFAGERYPSFLALQSEVVDEVPSTIERLLRRTPQRFILVVSSREVLRENATEMLTGAGVVTLPLDEVLLVDDAGQLRVSPEAERLLSSIRADVVSEVRARPRLLVPAQSKWNDVKVGYVDGHTVSISVRGLSARRQYADMGMADARSRQPNQQWTLFQGIIEARGILPRAGLEKQKKNRLALTRRLKDFFGIEGEPFESDGRGGWRAVFRVETS